MVKRFKKDSCSEYDLKALEAFRLKKEGKTYLQIGDILGVSKPYASSLVSIGKRLNRIIKMYN